VPSGIPKSALRLDTAIFDRLAAMRGPGILRLAAADQTRSLCLERGCVTPAVIADHIEPHKGDWNAFRLGPLTSLCASCHSRSLGDRGYSDTIDANGFPIDGRHPFNRGRAG
jgi:hypothetical protein